MELTTPLDAHRLVMQGTKDRPMRCVALEGDIGRCVACGIYDRRPTPCRELAVSQENGIPSDQCDRARLAWGLQPLRPEDFVSNSPFDFPTDTDSDPALPRAA